MKTRRRAVSSHGWLWRVVLLACAVFLFVKVVQVYVQIDEKGKQLAQIQDGIVKQTLIIEDLNEQIANADDYLERYANEAGWVLPGQQIYQDSAS